MVFWARTLGLLGAGWRFLGLPPEPGVGNYGLPSMKDGLLSISCCGSPVECFEKFSMDYGLLHGLVARYLGYLAFQGSFCRSRGAGWRFWCHIPTIIIKYTSNMP